MSLMDVNDENREVCPGGKLDIFALEQPTGRTSILRQTENLPNNRQQQKSIKVCFQTPMRDPVTKRIMSPAKSPKMTSVDECALALDSLNLHITPKRPSSTEEPKRELSLAGDDEPVHSCGAYQLDFDHLDSMDPFKSTNKMLLSPAGPVDEAPVGSPAVRPGVLLDDTLPFSSSVENSPMVAVSSTESSVVTLSTPQVTDLNDELQVAVAPESFEETPEVVEEAPAPPKGSYNFDFDDLDSMNPFQTGGSKIQNSPPSVKKVPEDEIVSRADAQLTAPIDTPTLEEPEPGKGGPVAMDFNFDDGAEVKRKPPKKLGKRPPGLKVKEKKPVSMVKPVQEPVVNGDIATQKGTYLFDFHKFDELACNPFGTKMAVTNSPQCGGKLPEAPVVQQQEDAVAPCDPSEPVATPPVSVQSEDSALTVQPEPEQVLLSEPVVLPEPEKPADQFNNNLSEFEEFIPGSAFINDLDGQMDYLEQFGSCTFKESALRKQSLYLKFDPLLRESPKKSLGPHAPFSRPSLSLVKSRLEAAGLIEDRSEPPKEDFRLVDTTSPLMAPVPSFIPTPAAEDAIIQVLQYSQQDLDAAIDRVREEGRQSDEQWSAKCVKLQEDTQEMRKILADYELMITKLMADQEKEREEAAQRLQEAHAEKEQVANDLNSTERSFSDLFKRLQKYKDVIEGFKKNEETLKACAQDYLARVRKEEQRYQALKAHAEEKIGSANNEISEVRGKFKAEVSALQVQLRREQMKVHSTEKNLDMKEKEVQELTKLCDELIKNMQKS